MSSSTSSSRSRSALLSLVVLALVLLGLEVFTRTWLFSASKDFRRFRTYPERALRLAQDERFRVALIGNSATDRGVDGRIFEEELSLHAGLPVAADLLVADRSRINTWHFMLERYLLRPGLHPDLILITFYENDLEDGNPVEIGRLAQFFTGVEDWPEVFQLDLPLLEQRLEFVLSSFWATFAARERIKERGLSLVIPQYKAMAAHVNAVNYLHHRRHQGASQKEPGHLALSRLLARAQRSGVRLCFVAYPTIPDGERPPYEVSPTVLHLIRQAGMDYLDLRRVRELPASRYADEVHLDEGGRPIYSRVLARAVAPLILGEDRSQASRQARRGPRLPR